MKNIAPSEKGEIQLPMKDWKPGEIINIKFLSSDSTLIDEYNLRLGKRDGEVLPVAQGQVNINRAENGILKIQSGDMQGQFNLRTGRLENIQIKGDTIIKYAPMLHFRYPEKDRLSVTQMNSKTEKFSIRKTDYSGEAGGAKINVTGNIGKLTLEYTISLSPGGLFEITYTVDGFSEKTKAEELGLAFELGKNIESLQWDRNSYWNAYPPDHIGAGKGETGLYDLNMNSYRKSPSGSWEYDNSSFYYNGLSGSEGLSFLAGSMKENIYFYTLTTRNDNELAVLSDGTHACRLKKSGSDFTLYINSKWDYPSLNWGNYIKDETLPGKLSDTIRLRIR